jgi:hypothetical protein
VFILKIFKSNQPTAVILIVLLGMSLWLKSFTHPVPQEVFYLNHPMPLFGLLQYLLGVGFASKLIALVLLIITGFMLVRLNTKFIFIQDRTYLPLFFFILLAGCYKSFQQLNPVVPAVIFLLLAFERMLETYRVDKLSLNPFEASFLVSIASLFYAPSAFFLLLIWIAVGLLRPGYWREWIYTFLGFAMPYLFLYSYYYLSGKNFSIQSRALVDFIFIPFSPGVSSSSFRLFLLYLMLLILISSIYLVRYYPAKKIISRRTFMLLFWWFLTVFGVFLFLPSVSTEIIILAAVPIAYVLSHFFLYAKSRKWIQELLFDVFLGILFYSTFFG